MVLFMKWGKKSEFREIEGFKLNPSLPSSQTLAAPFRISEFPALALPPVTSVPELQTLATVATAFSSSRIVLVSEVPMLPDVGVARSPTITAAEARPPPPPFRCWRAFFISSHHLGNHGVGNKSLGMFLPATVTTHEFALVFLSPSVGRKTRRWRGDWWAASVERSEADSDSRFFGLVGCLHDLRVG